MVTVGESSSFRGLLGRLGQDFGLAAIPRLSYEDDEGDLIVLSCQNDLNEVVHHFAGRTAKVHLTPNLEEQQAAAHTALELPTPGAANRGVLDPIDHADGSGTGRARAPESNTNPRSREMESKSTADASGTARARAASASSAISSEIPGAVATPIGVGSQAVHFGGLNGGMNVGTARVRARSPESVRPGISRGSMLASRNDSRRSRRAVRQVRRW